jgi:hypothetical protein
MPRHSAAAAVENRPGDGDTEKDLCATLSQMHKTAIERCKFNQVEAKEILRGYVQTDRRFDQFDPDRLVERIHECRSNGRTADLFDDPWLRGGEKRPLSF